MVFFCVTALCIDPDADLPKHDYFCDLHAVYESTNDLIFLHQDFVWLNSILLKECVVILNCVTHDSFL